MSTIQIPTGRPRTPDAGNLVLGIVKKLPWVIGVLLVLSMFSGAFTYVNPGYVGIKIDKVAGGVESTPLQPGLHFKMPFATEIEEYPVYMQTLVLTKSAGEGAAANDEINVNSVEGQPISIDVSLSFELDPSKTPRLYTTFRTDIASIQHGFVKQTIRQVLQEVIGSEEIAAILGPKKAETVGRSQRLLTDRLQQYGFIVKQFTLNEIRAPEAVMEAINTKNVMQQQALTAQNELQKNTFQAQGDSIKAAGRAMAILGEARAQAEANRLLSQSITPTLVQYEMTKKWNGQMPQVASNAIPMIQLPARQ